MSTLGHTPLPEQLAPERPWDPFSEESLWAACPGHAWARIGHVRGSQHEHITRCEGCRAARCEECQLPEGMTPQLWDRVPDDLKEAYRCTRERHHEGDHDFLTFYTAGVRL